MADFTTTQDAETTVITVTGDLNIRQITQFYELLLEVCSSRSPLALDLSHVTSIDLAALQLLCAAQHSLSQAGILLTRQGDLSAAVRQTMDDAAFTPDTTDSPSILAFMHSS